MSSQHPQPEAVLELRGVSRVYGSLRAVDNVSLRVDRGERRALIGPNGAGKSTLLNLISGHDSPTAGEVLFKGVNVGDRSEDARCRQGLAKTFQHSSLFDGLTASENVAIAARQRLRVASRPMRSAMAFEKVDQVVEGCLSRVALTDRARVTAGELSHGERRQLEVAMALATDPVLLLFDEPAAGMSQAETDRFVEMARALPSELTLLIVEHDMDVVFSIADRVTVLHAGQMLAEGTPDQISNSAAVQEAYLGRATTSELFTS